MIAFKDVVEQVTVGSAHKLELVEIGYSASEPELITRNGERVHTCNICASVLQCKPSQASHHRAEGALNNKHSFKQSVSRIMLLGLRSVVFVGNSLAVEYLGTVPVPCTYRGN